MNKPTCDGRRLETNNLEEASEWILNNIAGLRTFKLQIVIHSEDLGCSHPERPERPTNLRKWWPEELSENEKQARRAESDKYSAELRGEDD